jgi:DNA-binding XRE family transcriptional regulator
MSKRHLTTEEAENVRYAYFRVGLSQRTLADIYGVGRTTIRHILYGITYKEKSLPVTFRGYDEEQEGIPGPSKGGPVSLPGVGQYVEEPFPTWLGVWILITLLAMCIGIFGFAYGWWG